MSGQRQGRGVTLSGSLPRWVVIGVGLALVLVGTVLALRPFRSLAVLVVLLVGALALSGVGDLLRGRLPWGPLRGLVQLVAALALLLWPGPGLGVLTLVVAGALVLDGVLGLVEGARSAGQDRWAGLLTGMAFVLVGALALLWRDVALLVVAVAFGVRLVLLSVHLLRGRGRPQERGTRPSPGPWRLPPPSSPPPVRSRSPRWASSSSRATPSPTRSTQHRTEPPTNRGGCWPPRPSPRGCRTGRPPGASSTPPSGTTASLQWRAAWW